MPTPITWPLSAPTPAAPATPFVPGSGGGASRGQVDYGTDWNTFPDLDFKPISGLEAVAQALVRRLMDSTEGIDLSDWLNDDVGPAQIYDLQQTVSAQCLADERVSGAEVTVTTPALLSLDIDIAVTPANGSRPFRLVLRVDQLSVKVLSLEALA